MTVDTSFGKRRLLDRVLKTRQAHFANFENTDFTITAHAYAEGIEAGISGEDMFCMFLTSTGAAEFENSVIREIVKRGLIPEMWSDTEKGAERRAAILDVYDAAERDG